jgi:hypothetical protein
MACRIRSKFLLVVMSGRKNVRDVLLEGPYEPPRTRRGKFIACELRGKVKVGEFSDGPISWPMKWGTRSIILCGELIKAVKLESATAIMRNWGVSNHTVQKWRRALEVETYNPGTRWLQHMTALENTTPQKIRKLTMAARKVTRVRKSRRFRRYMAMHVRLQMKRTGRPINPRLKLWTPQEDALLGTERDEVIAGRMGRTAEAVRTRRRFLKIDLRAPNYRPWTAKEESILGTVPDYDAARMLGRPERGVQLRRQSLGIPAFSKAPRPWTVQEEALLGKVADREVARRTGRALATVQLRRHLRGIPNPSPLRRPWTEAEDAILGTMSDAAAAKQLGRAVRSVARRRYAKSIPDFSPKRKFWRPEEIKLLGTASDKEVARILGCDVRAVQTKRNRLGIGAPEAY